MSVNSTVVKVCGWILLLVTPALGLAAGSAETLLFEANRGQAAEPTRFLARAPGYDVFLAPTGAFLVPSNGTVIRLDWNGASTDVTLVGLEPQRARANYFIGVDPRGWIRDVPYVDRVRYQSVYPGVDVLFYGNGRRLELDFEVAAGANPHAIRFTIEGASDVSLDDAGNVVLVTGSGELRLQAPAIYQETSHGEREAVDGHYVLDGETVHFELGSFDGARPLVIDPILTFSTYLGGSDTDFGLGLTVDDASNLYVAGFANSIDFPTTPGSYSMVRNGTSDAFISKFDPAGNLMFSTYLGGTGADAIEELALDAAGNLYFVGGTDSTDFPATPGAFQTTYGGGSDVVIGKLSADGSSLLAATYLGGDSTEGTPGIALDGAGNVYVAGQVLSKDFPTTPGSFQPAAPSGVFLLFHAFATKLDSALSSLIYSTYIGGTGLTGSGPGFDVAVDASGHAYVVGTTSETDYPTTAGAFQTANAGGSCSTTNCSEAFLTKLSIDGSSLVYSTYLGGTGQDGGWSVEVDGAGNAYVTGSTEALDFPVSGAAQPTLGGGFDAYLTKFDPSGSALIFSTFLGGSGDEFGRSIDIDPSGNLLVTGRSDSLDFPVLDPVQVANAGDFDAFVARLTPSGAALTFATYLGGSARDSSAEARFTGGGAMVLAGFTDSTDFPTANPFQPASGGGTDAFVAVLADGAPLPVAIDVRPRTRFNWIVPWLPWPLPVAILSSETFDATRVDPSTVRFGPGDASPLSRTFVRDTNRDGRDDLVLRFLMHEVGISCSDRTVTLSGETEDGARFRGEDRVIPLLCWFR